MVITILRVVRFTQRLCLLMTIGETAWRLRLTFDDGIDVRAVEQVDVEVRPSFQDCFAAAGAGHPTVTEAYQLRSTLLNAQDCSLTSARW